MQTDTCRFLLMLYDTDVPGHVVLWTRQQKLPCWFPANERKAISQRIEQLATRWDVYIGVALQDQTAAFMKWKVENPNNLGTPTTRGYSETTIALPGLWADIDVQGPAHKAVNLPPSKEAARHWLTGFPLAPTIVVDSGHGLQIWWLFRELWTFDSAKERQDAQALTRRLLATLQDLAKPYGWYIDPTADLARMMRLPGTVNRKLSPVPVRIIELNESRRYNQSDFDPYLVEARQTEEDIPRHQWVGPSGAIAPVLSHCRFMHHCQNNAAILSEPEWYAMVSNLARLEGGRAAIHSLSQPYPRYSPIETEKKIAHALTASGPHTCAYIQHTLGFNKCPSIGCGVKAPAALGVTQKAKLLIEVRQQREENEVVARAVLARIRQHHGMGGR